VAETSPLQAPGARRSPGPYDQFGVPIVPTDDPGWQRPGDPLDESTIRQTAQLLYREIPIVTTATSWSVFQVRAALERLTVGLFDEPSQLVDSVIGDSRVQAAMSSRTGGLLGRPVDISVPKKFRDSDAAKECRDAFEDAWDEIGGEQVLADVERWGTMLGLSPAQLLWDLDGPYAIPHITPWHPRYTYWHWTYRKLIATTLDGQVPVTAGDGHWFNHCPYGEYRGWMRGAVRAIGPWWLARNYALRDWARYSERHGMPIILGLTPAAAKAEDINRFRGDLQQLGQDSVVQLPQGEKPEQSYNLKYLEAMDKSHEGFGMLIAKCDAEITLALMSQNLTTEVKEGSFAAARVHADVRQSLLEADARALGHTIYMQVARPFAALNFGNADLAPRVTWDVKPYEDDETAAKTFLAFAEAIQMLARGGKGIDKLEGLARKFGINLGASKFVDITPIGTGGAGAGPGLGGSEESGAPPRGDK